MPILPPTLIIFPEFPVNEFLKVRISTHRWGKIVRAVLAQKKCCIFHMQSKKDRGAFYPTVIRYNKRLKRLNPNTKEQVQVFTLGLTEYGAKKMTWLMMLAPLQQTEAQALECYLKLISAGEPIGKLSRRRSFAVKIAEALRGNPIAISHKKELHSKVALLKKYLKTRAPDPSIITDGWVEHTENSIGYTPQALELWSSVIQHQLVAIKKRRNPTNTSEDGGEEITA
jgi:hypothetical protein